MLSKEHLEKKKAVLVAEQTRLQQEWWAYVGAIKVVDQLIGEADAAAAAAAEKEAEKPAEDAEEALAECLDKGGVKEGPNHA